MSDDAPSFVRGIFAGAIHDDLLFPFPASLDERDPDEARTVRRLIADLERMRQSGLIDLAKSPAVRPSDRRAIRLNTQ